MKLFIILSRFSLIALLIIDDVALIIKPFYTDFIRRFIYVIIESRIHKILFWNFIGQKPNSKIDQWVV